MNARSAICHVTDATRENVGLAIEEQQRFSLDPRSDDRPSLLPRGL
jgi:hypothetical protein